jgi:hypothetical protein
MHRDEHLPVGNTMPPSASIEAVLTGHRWVEWLRQHEETIRRVIILSCLYMIPVMWILQPVIIDADIWWHLETGKWIVEHGALPATDPFSIYGEDKPWIAYSWLFELGMFKLVRACGEVGIILYTLVGAWMIMLALHWLIEKRIQDFAMVCGLVAMCMVALSRMFTPRPWLLTIVFFAVTLEVVLLLREGKQTRIIWILPTVFVLWANIHIQFIYGLGLLGLACIAPLIDRLVYRGTQHQPAMLWGPRPWRTLVGLTALCVVATLATPHHVKLYAVVAELSAQTGMWEYTQEMQAPSFRSLADWAMLALFSLTLVQLGRRTHSSSFEVLLVLVASASAFRGQRDVWFLVLACLAVLASLKYRGTNERWSIVSRGYLAPVTFCVIAGVICLLEYRDFSEAKIQENTAKVYPIAAATFVEQQGYRGPLYNDFDWGGYLIWRLPHLKVSMDGRANVHGDERIKRSLATWNGSSHWNEDPELNQAQVVIAQKDMALAALLRLDPRFIVAYEDDTAVVFAGPLREGEQSNTPAAGSPPRLSMTFDVASSQ